MERRHRLILLTIGFVAGAMLITSLVGISWWSGENSVIDLRRVELCNAGKCIHDSLSTFGEKANPWIFLSSLTWASGVSAIFFIVLAGVYLGFQKRSRVSETLTGVFALLGLIFAMGVFITAPIRDSFQLSWGWAYFAAGGLCALLFSVTARFRSAND